MSRPASRMEPESVRKLPEIALNSVDLPAPLEPMMVTKSPRSRWRDSPVSACFSLTVPGLKVFEMLEMVSMAYRPPFAVPLRWDRRRRIMGHRRFR